MAEAVKIAGYTIEEDTVVPRAELPTLISGVKELGKQYNFNAVCYGHAGDGNLHIRIKKEGTPNSLGNEEMNKASCAHCLNWCIALAEPSAENME